MYTYSRGGLFAHPYELGANIYCESIHDDEASEAAKRIVRQANYVGLITIEFRRDSTNGSLKLIKVDPRPVRATSLSTVLGLDLPTTLYQVFTGGQVTPSHSYPDGIAWLWVSTYVETLWDNRFNNPVRKEIIALLRNFRRVKAFGLLSARDLFPFLVTMKRLLLFRVRDKAIRIFKSLIPPWAVRAIKPLLMGANRT